MPVKPQPSTVSCTQCAWSKHYAPRSDVVLPDEIPPEKCPKCGAELVVSHKPSLFGLLNNLPIKF